MLIVHAKNTGLVLQEKIKLYDYRVGSKKKKHPNSWTPTFLNIMGFKWSFKKIVRAIVVDLEMIIVQRCWPAGNEKKLHGRFFHITFHFRRRVTVFSGNIETWRPFRIKKKKSL